MTGPFVPTRFATAVIAAAIVLATSAAASAHPTALTHALITVNLNRTLEVTFTTLGEPLVAKLEAVGQGHPEQATTADAIKTRIAALRDILTARVLVSADGVPIELRFVEVVPVPDERGKFAVRLAGRIPPGATRLSWSSSLVLGTYPLAVRREGAVAPASEDAFEWLTGSETSGEYDLGSLTAGSRTARFLRSIAIGFAHIVPKGLDHILFVLGLFLLAARTRTVLLQVTAFTVAHSITLALSIYGVFTLPGSVVEPLIALSIVYVAFENLFTSTLTPWRLALVFAFGLLHGLGFAEALTALDLPRSEFLSTLIAFNLGVEGGQLAVIVAAALLLFAARIPAADYRRCVARPGSIAIAIAGAYWMVERLAG
jgi:hypothetical protein